MIILFYVVAVGFMVVGHLIKVKRWKLYISVYEDAAEGNLLNAMSLGHTINALLPWRVGDFFRIIWSGKKLKNGYPLAIATVFTDLYVDLLTVGLMFFGLSLIGKGGPMLKETAKVYLIAFVVVIPLTVLFFLFRKPVKKAVVAVAGLFNNKIEFNILYVSYLFVASLKDIIQKISKTKFILFTIGIWTGYVASYLVFAEAIQRYGYFYSTSDVFALLFSGSSLYHVESGARLFWGSYLVFPLIICWGISAIILRQKPNQEKVYHKILPQMNEVDRLSFLKTYYEEDKREYINAFLEINQDVSILEDRTAGSDASTVIAIKQDGTLIYRKYAFNEAAIKLEAQAAWIESHKGVIPLPKVSGKRNGQNYFTYDMPNYHSAVGMFHYIHTVTTETAWAILRSALDSISNNLHAMNVAVSNNNLLEEYIAEKAVKNLRFVESQKAIHLLEQYDVITVNGRELKTLRHYHDMLSEEHLRDVFSQDTCAEIHGDLTIENIICLTEPIELDDQDFNGAKKPTDFYFIDPNTGNVHNSPYLDLAKLLQSLHGNYEFLMAVSGINIHDNQISYMMIASSCYRDLYKKYDAYLRLRFSDSQVKSIYYHEIVHWLRLLPYKFRKNENLGVLFYTGFLTVLEDIREMYDE